MPHRNFYVANFGCRVSQSEGAAIEQELLDSAADRANSAYDASVVVVNTCTVTEEADREARQMIRRIGRRNPDARVIVTGCYAQRAPEEIATMPHVSHVVGNSHKALVAQLTLQALHEDQAHSTAEGRAEVFCSSIFPHMELDPGMHLGSAGRTRAVVKVQDGCNANCSFCIIPSVRGRSRSMNPAMVMDEVRTLVERGYREVVLSGIHLGSYGRDLEAKASLIELILSLFDRVPNLARLRLSSIEPLEVTPELIDLVCTHPRMARHFHIPFQSGSRRVLREMRRPYQPEYYRRLVESIRNASDHAGIGADVMVGFPGETDAEFLETYRLIENSPLTYLHVFPYSSRPGTVAADLPLHVPQRVGQFRAQALRKLIAEKNAAFRAKMVGRTLDVLVLQPEEGLTSNFIRIRVPAELRPNEWVELRVTALDGDGLQASKMTTAHETN